jgi:hypothetical protein
MEIMMITEKEGLPMGMMVIGCGYADGWMLRA